MGGIEMKHVRMRHIRMRHAKMEHIRIDSATRIFPAEHFVEPPNEGCYLIGVVAGMRRGYWAKHLIGTDCNGDDVPVIAVCGSGYYIGDHGALCDANITDVRRIYAPPDYTLDETIELILSAFERAGEPFTDNTAHVRQNLAMIIDRGIRQCQFLADASRVVW